MQGSDSQVFQSATAGLRSLQTRPEIVVIESPAPQRLAPFSMALSAEVTIDGEESGDGRLVLLHNPEGHPAWQGFWRIVIFAKAVLEPEMAADPMLSDVGWSWLEEAITEQDVPLAAFGGTVTRTHSASYGAIDDREALGQLEVRASWTPLDENLTAHAQAFLNLLETMCGLAPLPEGVTSIAR